MKILIPNVTGPTNIGDQAILEGLLLLIAKKYPGAKITIHTSDPELYENDSRFQAIKPHLYFWAVFEDTNPLVRIYRLCQLILAWITIKLNFNPKILVSEKLADLLNDYSTSDKIIFTGGGYFRSKTGFTQSLNLLMILSMFILARIYKEKVIITPMSFGPFAYKWQEKLSVGILKKFKHIHVREEFSYNLFRKYNLNNVILSYDMAVMLYNKNLKNINDVPVLGFTIREWRKPEDQKILEECFATAIEKFHHTTNCKILPIIQVQGEDDDSRTTNSVVNILKEHGVPVLGNQIIKDVRHAKEIYRSIDILLGMRMHSNIIAATQEVPFVAVSYEYKTEGIAKYLGMSDYCLRQEDVTAEKLYKLLREVYLNKDALIERIKNSIIATKNELGKEFT